MLRDPLALGMLGFLVLNLIARAPGTRWIRIVSAGAALAALVLGDDVGTVVALLAWFVWPPAFLAAWAASHDPDAPPDAAQVHATRARVTLAAVIAAVAVAAVAYRVVLGHGLQQTAALFIGIPSLLAMVVALVVTPRTATGVAVKAMTIGLLVSLLFLGEGLLCIAMSAPLFYLVAIGIGTLAERHQRKRRRRRTVLSCVLLLAAAPMSFEGTSDATSWPRDERVSVTRTVAASPAGVAEALGGAPRFNRPLPLFLRAGFPRPVRVKIDAGDEHRVWTVTFRGGETRLDGQEPAPGDLVLRLSEARPGLMRWSAVSDDSHMTHFLDWRESIVEWKASDEGGTTVTWTLVYRRGLDPAWYFGPWQRYAMRLAAAYLIDTVATP